MAPQVIVLISMIVTSLLVALALALAWQRFGREPHAALWTAGFLAVTAGHAGQLLRLLMPEVGIYARSLSAGAMLASVTLVAQGFRLRAGRHDRPWLLPMLAATATVATCVAMLVAPQVRFLPPLMMNLFASGMMVLAALAVRNGLDSRRAPGTVAFWWMLCFAGYCATMAAMAAAIPLGGAITLEAYRFFYLIGMPAGMTGSGLVTLLLLGGDLAERLHRLAEVDPLTGVLNRRGIERAGSRAIALARRNSRPVTLVVADLDRFKAINDNYGHALGDLVLKRFAEHAADHMRGGDLIGRLGGEEFVFVLVDTVAGRAAEAVERLRRGLARAMDDLGVPVSLTASFGIASLGDRSDTLEALLARADAALYRSKDDGRDRVSFAAAQTSTTDPRFRAAWLRGAATGDQVRSRSRAS